MTFTKRVSKWGLLGSRNAVGMPWRFLSDARHIFDCEVDAYKAALDMTSQNYQYKPISIIVEVELPKNLKKEESND